ncbi:helicase HerA domain-containing protein [Tessaracoccus coleopterorum]|uniref:helicase HerA domain-containing protein n=1 Tax=Tessaracoccus coleopterorum TaxID=2714950 RepID=UPI0018D2D75A|nr:DUF87 domain-containing protein [Tessaracoccus coleopterorum]
MTEFTIGTTLGGADAARLDARRFNRHTFWCGQSGSGKTYALGVILEQLLLHTELPMLILDPNGDFVRLAETRPTAGPEDAARLAEVDIRVLRSGKASTGERLRARYTDLSPPPRQLSCSSTRSWTPRSTTCSFTARTTRPPSTAPRSSPRCVPRAARDGGAGQPHRQPAGARLGSVVLRDDSVTDIIDERPEPRCWIWAVSRTPPSRRSQPWRCWSTCGRGARSDARSSSSSMRRTTSAHPNRAPRSSGPSPSSSCRSRRRAVSSGCGSSSRPSGRRRSTPTCSPNATTWG